MSNVLNEKAVEKAVYHHVAIRDLEPDALTAVSEDRKLGLLPEDMIEVQKYYREAGREPTDVELEVIAQTWSEHCKHRIFGALIQHERDGVKEEVNGLFKTYVHAPTTQIMDAKPGFVLSCFHDNAGFIGLDDDKAICLKAETHNHPSAIEPYAGANTGLGGVIRDILGAGKGATPIASLDVFCFGAPDTPTDEVKGRDVIHPLGIMRGVVRGVRDYGNRMGIPTTSGALQFDPSYIYNPLVFCGTAGVIDRKYIDKEMVGGLKIIALGGRTGRDGLKGATFSSAALDEDSAEEDNQAVQIGNPIEEKKVLDCILAARDEDLIEFITDCGAGGFSSAAGEMLSETGGEIFLENCPLKEPGLESWEVFISESQERMVLAVNESSVARIVELAEMFETEAVVIGDSNDSGILKVWHYGELVCELDCKKLHTAPRRHLTAKWETPKTRADHDFSGVDLSKQLDEILADFAICSRAPIIREYDHEVQGNTLLKPLAGAKGDAPQDGSVIAINGSEKAMAMSLAILPEWGKIAPLEMGAACVDECVRQLILTGADPDQIAILDNFCVGNPDDPEILGALVETCKGMATTAVEYGAPFVSGKDSFYNYFETEDGQSISVPTTLLVSGMGVVNSEAHVVGSSLRASDSVLVLVGDPSTDLGGSVFARLHEISDAAAPTFDPAIALARYRIYAKLRDAGQIISAHDISEGGLAVALAEMGFSEKGGIEISLPDGNGDGSTAHQLFNEGPGQFVIEVTAADLAAVQSAFGDAATVLGKSTDAHANLVITQGDTTLIESSLADLKQTWKTSLTPYY